MKRHIPNIFTCGNLICGCIGIDFINHGDYITGVYCMYLGIVFDFIDGLAARMLKVSSAIGKELDSLADIVSFGILPSILMMNIIEENLSEPWGMAKYFVLCIPIFSALRLAQFNIDTKRKDFFIGIPTPASALFFSAFPFILNDKDFFMRAWFSLPLFQIGAILIMSSLLVVRIPFFSFKFKNMSFYDNRMRFILISVGLILFIYMDFSSIPFIIALYILLSMANFFEYKLYK